MTDPGSIRSAELEAPCEHCTMPHPSGTPCGSADADTDAGVAWGSR